MGKPILKSDRKSASKKSVFEDDNHDSDKISEKKIIGSAANPRKKKKETKVEKSTDLESDFGAESKSFLLKPDDAEKSKAKVGKKAKKAKPTTSELKKKAKKAKSNLDKEMDIVDGHAEEFADNTWVATYHLMFKKLRKIMRATEKRVVDSEKSTDIYALMALYNQMREVIADLRSMIDLSQNTQRIIDQVLYPLTRDISNNYIDSIYKTMKSLRMQVDGEKFTELRSELEKFMGEHGKYIQAAYEKSSQRLSDLLED